MEHTVVAGSMEVLKPCWAVATSGVPVREQLFNVSICQQAHFNIFHHSGGDSWSLGHHRYRSTDDDIHSLEVATPVLLPRPDGHRHRRGSHGDVIFLNSHGEASLKKPSKLALPFSLNKILSVVQLTAYSPGLHGHGAEWRWQLSTGASWSNAEAPVGMGEAAAVVPTLKVVQLRAGDEREVVIAAGELEAVVVSPGGVVLATVELPAAPTHAVIVGDFSGDGLADIIVSTTSGVYGLVQRRHPGAIFFSTLVGCLIFVMAVIFVLQHLSTNTKPKPRVAPGGYRA